MDAVLDGSFNRCETCGKRATVEVTYCVESHRENHREGLAAVTFETRRTSYRCADHNSFGAATRGSRRLPR